MNTPLPIAVLISGNGSNLQAIIDQQLRGNLQYEIKVVISNQQSAFGIQRAQKVNIPVRIISHQNFESREDFDDAISITLQEYHVEFIVLAGFMRLLSQKFVRQWKHKIINIHPSLLPAFPGLNAPEQALKHGVKVTGCTVFFVDEGIDTGCILLQEVVPVESNDTVDSLRRRIQKKEHQILPKAIHLIANQRYVIENRIVHLLNHQS